MTSLETPTREIDRLQDETDEWCDDCDTLNPYIARELLYEWWKVWDAADKALVAAVTAANQLPDLAAQNRALWDFVRAYDAAQSMAAGYGWEKVELSLVDAARAALGDVPS